MADLTDWELARYRVFLHTRAEMLRLHPRIRARFDESDLVQETLLRAADPRTPPCRGTTDRERLAWLEEIQNNVCIDKYREMTAQKRDLGREQDLVSVLSQSTVHWEKELCDPRPSPPEQAARNEQVLRIAKTVQQLPREQRETILARLFLGLTLEETAASLGKTKGAVAGLYCRGIARLRELLGLTGETVDER